MYFYVPETRNVALGREMDAVFGDVDVRDEEEEVGEMEVDERTVLLGGDERMRMRRASLGSYT